MSITRANLEAVLIKRCGDLLTTAGLDGTTAGGTNAMRDNHDPVSAMRITHASPSLPAKR